MRLHEQLLKDKTASKTCVRCSSTLSAGASVRTGREHGTQGLTPSSYAVHIPQVPGPCLSPWLGLGDTWPCELLHSTETSPGKSGGGRRSRSFSCHGRLPCRCSLNERIPANPVLLILIIPFSEPSGVSQGLLSPLGQLCQAQECPERVSSQLCH